MFETLVDTLNLTDTTPQQAAVALGLIVGAIFGLLAQTTRFCLRRAVAGPSEERSAAGGVWSIALLSALLGTQIVLMTTPVSFDEHRFMSSNIPFLAVISGGLMFGIGMVLTRGCVSRLSILAGSGNLRALLVLLVFAVTAHATLKGVLSPLRTWISSFTWSTPLTSLSALPGGTWPYFIAIAALLLLFIWRSGASQSTLIGGALLGLLVPLAWWGNGYLLADEFDPLPLESLSFTLAHTQTAFWLMASTAVASNFGVGLIGGVFSGSLLTHLARRQFRWQSFESPRQTGRYLCGAILMAIGGVLAGGCSVGAGLSGVSTLSVAAIIALLSIIVGGIIAAKLDYYSH